MSKNHADELSDEEFAEMQIALVKLIEARGIRCRGCIAAILGSTAAVTAEYVALKTATPNKSKSKLH